MTYTVFVGSWDDGDPDWTSFRQGGLDWDAAKAVMIEHLRLYEDDTCDDCRETAIAAINGLNARGVGRFEAEVDGDEYLIIPE